MLKYSMSQVETLTGISAHALRVWERRYNFILPKRSPANIRYYSDDQLKQLLNVSILIRNGHRISKIAKLLPREIFELVSAILLSGSEIHEDRINGLVLSMLEMDEHAFNRIFNKAVKETDLLTTIIKLIYPFLNLVGGLWINNKAIPAQEHFISNLIRQKIITAIDKLAPPKENAKKILLFLLEGESHEISLLIASYIAKKLGWKTYYLGQNVPLKNINEICAIIGSDLMFTIFITPRNKNISSLILKLTEDNTTPLAYSGSPTNFIDYAPIKKTIYIQNPLDFENALNQFA